MSDQHPHPEYIHQNNKLFFQEMIYSFNSQQSLIDIVFSGSSAYLLPVNIEKEIKNYVYQLYPTLKESADIISQAFALLNQIAYCAD